MAIVHDYLNQRGGGERVVLELARIWPRAPIYTLAYRPGATYPEFGDRRVRTSLLDRLPSGRAFRLAAPLYPAAFGAFGRLRHDLVVSSSSGWAHHVATSSDSAHVVYCHTLARWVYAPQDHFSRAGRRATAPLVGVLRRADRAAARRADLYVANAENVRRAIRAAYGIEAGVIHPPVDTDRFSPAPRGERLLVVSRLLPYKRIDLIVQAATRAGLGLDVVGEGPSLAGLRELAGPSVAFHGRLDDADVTELMERCRAVCVPGTEEFGIVPVEANAAGKPVVAFAAGGVLETLQDGVTGVLFRDQTVDAVLAAIRRADELSTPSEALAESARRFSRTAFRERFVAAVEGVLERRAGPIMEARHGAGTQTPKAS